MCAHLKTIITKHTSMCALLQTMISKDTFRARSLISEMTGYASVLTILAFSMVTAFPDPFVENLPVLYTPDS